jgi:hypothetical protein
MKGVYENWQTGPNKPLEDTHTNIMTQEVSFYFMYKDKIK